MDDLDFVFTITERGQIKTFLESDSGIQQQEGKLYRKCLSGHIAVARAVRTLIIVETFDMQDSDS